MKVAILVTLIVLPMLTSIGLYCYAFASTRWSALDERLIRQHAAEQRPADANVAPKNLQLQRQTIRHAFRSHYGLYGYCLDYRWISLLVPAASASAEQSYRSDPATLACRRCNDPRNRCPQNSCCMVRCDTVPDCPSYDDEKDCNRPYNQTRYYWPKGNCMWQSTWIGNLPLPMDVPTAQAPPRDHHKFFKLVRHYLMLVLFVAAPLLTFVALLIMLCLNCVERFYSIPFAFVGFISLTAFLSGAGALGLFLYEWVHERLHRPEFAYEFKSDEALVLTLNPWLVEVERFGLAFWLIVAAVGTSLLTALLSCCFCCGLQSEKSKLRFHVDNDVYEIVQMAPYDE